MTVDAHQHFIAFSEGDYPWIGPETAPLKRDFLPNDLEPLCGSLGIDRTVAVQARQTLEETDWLLGLARTHRFIAGVVGWVDLRDPALETVLCRYSGESLLKGVRHVLHDERDDNFMLEEDFLRGIGKLAELDLTYDILVFERHLPQTLELVRRFPSQPFVIDHIAKPPVAEGQVARWRELVRPIAQRRNVFCKLSGMVTEARPGLWRRGALKPYIETILELFGPERTMFGSDWPVCTLEGSYEEVFAVVEEATAGLSRAERAAVFGDTATRFYKLSA